MSIEAESAKLVSKAMTGVFLFLRMSTRIPFWDFPLVSQGVEIITEALRERLRLINQIEPYLAVPLATCVPQMFSVRWSTKVRLTQRACKPYTGSGSCSSIKGGHVD